MNRIVLDTNSLIQCISPKSRYRKIWDCFLDGTNQLCVSDEILNEYEEILERLAGVEIAKLVIDVILNNPYTLFFTPYYNFNLINQIRMIISLWTVQLWLMPSLLLRKIIIFIY